MTIHCKKSGGDLKLGTYVDNQGTYAPQGVTELSTPLWSVRSI